MIQKAVCNCRRFCIDFKYSGQQEKKMRKRLFITGKYQLMYLKSVYFCLIFDFYLVKVNNI